MSHWHPSIFCIFCENVFHVKFTFKWMNFEQNRLTSVMWVGPLEIRNSVSMLPFRLEQQFFLGFQSADFGLIPLFLYNCMNQLLNQTPAFPFPECSIFTHTHTHTHIHIHPFGSVSLQNLDLYRNQLKFTNELEDKDASRIESRTVR
jgi:hypothetical protein